MSHKAVKQAAQQVLLRHQQRQQQQQQRDEDVLLLAQQPADVLSARMNAAVASILQYRGWRNAQQYKATTAAATAACAASMLAWVQQTLQQVYATTAEEDWAVLIRDAREHGANNARLVAAVQYRLECKLLLTAVAEVSAALVCDGGVPDEVGCGAS